MRNEFDLVISFMGSQHCNPELHDFLDEAGFGDFQFHKWDSVLMERLESQQLDLMEAGRERNVLILVDDITLDHVEPFMCKGPALSCVGDDAQRFLQ